MIGLILAGGRGERFKPVTDYLPKVMIPLNNRPIIDYNVEMCKKFGCKKIYVLAGYKAECIADYYKGSKKVIVIRENEPKGTGGAILSFCNGEDDLLVLNGDSIYEVDLYDMYEQLKKSYCSISIASAWVSNNSSFGTLKLVRGKVMGFFEKPKTASKGFVSVGLYMFKKHFRICEAQGWKGMLETDVFPEEAVCRNILAFKNANWYPIDNPERFKEAEKRYGNIPNKS